MYFTNRPSQTVMFLQGFTQTKSIYFSKALLFYSNTGFNAVPQRVPGNSPYFKSFADYKLGETFDLLESREALQKDWDRLD